MNLQSIVVTCGLVLPTIFVLTCRRNRTLRARAIKRITWIVEILRLPGGNAHTIEYMDEINTLTDRFSNIQSSEVDLDSWNELFIIARKAYRMHCLLTYQKHSRLRKHVLATVQNSQGIFDECFLMELIPLAAAYQQSLECITQLRSSYRQFRDLCDMELATFVYLDKAA